MTILPLEHGDSRGSPCAPARRHRIAAALCLTFLLVARQGFAQDLDKPPELSDEGGAIPVRVIDGRLVVACDVSGSKLRIPVNLWLDFDGAYGFQLHNRAAANLPAETQTGQPLPLTLHFPDFTLDLARRELGPEEDFEEFTKYHSKEIGENALVGAIGSQVLKHFDITFDLPRGQISLSPPGRLAERGPDQSVDEIITPITTKNDLVWLPVTLTKGDDTLRRAMAITTSRYDSLMNRQLCNSLQRPAGNVGPVRCEMIDFAPYVAFRPAEIVQVHPDGVGGTIGLNLLENFRVHVDRESLLASLQSARSPSFPNEELAWFQAMVAEDSQLVLDWLGEHSQTRLGREAAEFLLTLLLDEGAEEDELATAVQWVNDTMPKDLRATRLFDLMEELVNEGEGELGIVAGKLGVKSARADRYPESNYKLHGRLGELLLPTDNREAWRHLLSAAFGLPEDGMINLNLGRCYEANGKRKRAFSRYIQALVKEESSELAMAALMKMDAQLPPEQRMTIETIDRMISGRVRNYSAPTKYEPDPDKRTNRTSVVEFFTNAYYGTEQRGGAIGGALGNQGAMTHFSDDQCVFLSYHLPAPRPEPLVTPLALHMSNWLNATAPNVQVVDGRRRAPGAGRHRHAEQIYEATRDAVIAQLRDASPITISGDAKVSDEHVRGKIVVQLPALDQFDEASTTSPLVLQIVIAERGVVFHGSSGVVIHRMVGRGLATRGSLNGVAVKPNFDGRFEVSFDRDLAELAAENADRNDEVQNDSPWPQSEPGVEVAGEGGEPDDSRNMDTRPKTTGILEEVDRALS
ncbi:MAG: hypothetical protein QF805_10490, partial [Pirellulaceae bacterium]|nr:hypothetical protein [Pirellulaceae bacterium]